MDDRLNTIGPPKRRTRLTSDARSIERSLEDICRDLRRLSERVSDVQLTTLGFTASVERGLKERGCLSLVSLVPTTRIMGDISKENEARAAYVLKELEELTLICREIENFLK